MNAAGYESLKTAVELLENLLSRMPGEGDTAVLLELQTTADNLFQALHTHQGSAESDDGLLPDLVSRKPELMPQSDELTRDHAEMLSRATELQREAAQQLASEDFDLEIIQMKAGLLRDITRLHLRKSDTLTYEAYLRVEGGEGG